MGFAGRGAGGGGGSRGSGCGMVGFRYFEGNFQDSIANYVADLCVLTSDDDVEVAIV